MKKKEIKKHNLVTENDSKYTNLILIGIVIFTAIIYSNSLRNGILNFDDVQYFNNYPEIIHLSWKSITKYFSGYYVIMYQPLPVLTFAINYYYTELDTFPIHLVNLCLHLANTILVYHFVKQLSGKQNIAILVSLLFAIHPINVESVSWISARSSSMYTFFYLLSLINYILYLKHDRKSKYIIFSGIFFILSLFSKAQALTLPIVLLLIDYLLSRKFTLYSLLEKLPFFILSIVFGLITISDKSTVLNITNGMLISYTIPEIFFMICYSFMFYIFKLIVPINLCSINVFPPVNNGFLPIEYYLAPIFFAAVIYFIYKFRENRNIVFGILLFFITISINIQIIPSRLFIVAERYAYFPCIGLIFTICFFYNTIKKLSIKTFLTFAIVAYCIFFSYSVWNRNKIWKDDLVLLSDIIDKNAPVPYISRAYGNRGNYYMSNNLPNEAILDFSKAIEIKPDDAQSYYNRALAFIKINKMSEALNDLNIAEKYKPGNALIFSNRAFIKYNINDINGALNDCNNCLKIDSNISEAHNIRAAIEIKQKNYKGCEIDLNKAIGINPNFSEAYLNRGLLYYNTKRLEKACSDWKISMSLGNQDAENFHNKYCK